MSFGGESAKRQTLQRDLNPQRISKVKVLRNRGQTY